MKLLNGQRRQWFPAARLALCVVLAVAVAGALPGTTRACGLAVHHEIVDRAYAALDRQGYPELARLLEAYPGGGDGGAAWLPQPGGAAGLPGTGAGARGYGRDGRTGTRGDG